MKVKEQIKQRATAVSNDVKRNAPPLLIFLGIGGFVTTVAMAIKASPKALEIQKEFKEDTTVWEKAKALAPVYIPTIAVGVSSIACILAANTMYTRRLGALAAAYKLTETAYREYKDGVLETVGEKKEKSIREKIAEKALKETKDEIPPDYKEFAGRKTLFWDKSTGGFFMSDKITVDKIINELNARLILENYLSLNEFREAMGNMPVDYGNLIGWNMDNGLIVVDMVTGSDPYTGDPCWVLTYDVEPGYNFEKIW